MEREHEGEPMIIICPPVRMSGVNMLGEYHNIIYDSARYAEEKPLYFVFLKEKRKVEVLTKIGKETFETREANPMELERFWEAYSAGACFVQIGERKIPISPEGKWM